MHLEPIGFIQTPFRQKFAIPRQPNLVPEAVGAITFKPDFSDPNLLRQLDQFSHLWLLFWFNATADQGWTATVQPPRLGGKEKVGALASRSPFRPNPIGLSAVSNLGHRYTDGKLILEVGGVDLLDGTPILDIKPYIPYADSIAQATGGYASEAPGSSLTVVFSGDAQRQLDLLTVQHPQLRELITGLLQQDPRPAWRVKDGDDKQYGMHIYNCNVKWRVLDEQILVVDISSAP
jgi:tRNA-Thr(GGU) m(6)t(6)A37 methyltransferase TsaA